MFASQNAAVLEQNAAILQATQKLMATKDYPVTQAVTKETSRQVKLYDNDSTNTETDPDAIYDIVVAKMVSWVKVRVAVGFRARAMAEMVGFHGRLLCR